MIQNIFRGLQGLPVRAQLIAFCLLCPLFPVVLLWDGLVWVGRQLIVDWWLSQTHIRCPAGHLNQTKGPDVAWLCRCGFSYGDGASGLGRCELCGEAPAYLSCACGRSIPNPIFNLINS